MAMAAAAFLILLLAAPAVYAVDHTVGGSTGWSTSGDYTTWAAGETFTVGDSLVFNYGSSHGVDQVSQDDYSNCASGNALNSYSGGKTTISLKTAGSMYFICPTIGHCSEGMKLAINVVAASTNGTTPSTPSGSTSPPSTTTSSSPSGAAGGFGNMNHMMLGFSIVLAMVLAIMG